MTRPSVRLRRAAALAALALALAVAAPAPAADLPGSGGVRVNGRSVSAERVWEEYRFQGTLRSFIHNRPAGEVDEKLFASVVAQMINRELLEQEAARLGFALSEADRAEARRLQVEAWKGEQGFQTAARMMGIPPDYLVDRAASGLVRDRMIAAAVPATPAADDGQLRRYYEGHLADYAEKDPPLRYILVTPKPGVRPADLFRQIATEAEALRAAGKSYAPLAAKYSAHPGAAAGGLAPAVAPGRPRDLPDGRLTNFTIADGGLHLYLRDVSVPRPYAEVVDRVRKDELDDRRRRWVVATLERLAASAQVERLVGPPPPPPQGGTSH